MLTEGGQSYQCARCLEVKPRTPEHFCIDARGQVSGYCRPCQRAYCRAYWAAGQSRRPPHYARDWNRRRFAIPPERWKQRHDEMAS